jgi:DivIVA domain-containing protein
MTPEDIRSQRFATQLVRGLSPEEVSAFLEDVAEAFGNVQKANASLATRVKMLEDAAQALSAQDTTPSQALDGLRAATLREIEALLHDAQARAQAVVEAAQAREAAALRDAEAVRVRAQQEADEVVTAAKARAESVLAAAQEQQVALREEIDRLTRSHLELVDSIRTTVDTYYDWLAAIDPRGRTRGRRDTFEIAPPVEAGDAARVG